MATNLLESLETMDKHIKDIEKAVKGTLERFRTAGIKVDEDFINYFEEKTTDG